MKTTRRARAAALAQCAASSLPFDRLVRRLFREPSHTLDGLEQTGGRIAEVLVYWSHSSLLGGAQGLQSFDCLRLVWGEDQMAALAIVVGTLPLYAPDMAISRYQRGRLLVHQLATGWAAEMIARRCEAPQPTAFLCGALHDVGYGVLERLARSRFSQIVMDVDELTETVSLERECFDCDHTMIGAELLALWGASETVCDAVRWHHQPLNAPHAESRQMASIVSLANFLVSRLGRSSLGVHNLPAPTEEVFAELGLGYRSLSELIDQLLQTLPESDLLAVV